MNPLLPLKTERFPSILQLADGRLTCAGESLELPLGKAFELLDRVKARFDCIVVDLTGTVATEGLPSAPKTQPFVGGTKRRILIDTDSGPTECDATYAGWVVANRLLTGMGEGAVFVRGDGKLILDTEFAKRIWARVNLRANETVFYFAADYVRSGTAIPTFLPEAASAVLAHRTSALAHASTVASTFDLDTTSVPRFRAVRSEARRRSDGKPYWNVRLSVDNALLFQITSFQQYSEVLTVAETDRFAACSDLRLLDLATLADVRETVSEMLRHPGLSVHPTAKALWADTVRTAKLLRVPLVRPAVTQRIAWLDEAANVECREDLFANDGSVDESGIEAHPSFREGRSYTVSSRIFLGCKIEKRYRPGKGGTEDVLITGQELMLLLVDDTGRLHAFTQFPVSEEQKREEFETVKRFHRLQKLVKHFKLPDVPDIATTDPELYQTYVDRLHELETA